MLCASTIIKSPRNEKFEVTGAPSTEESFWLSCNLEKIMSFQKAN